MWGIPIRRISVTTLATDEFLKRIIKDDVLMYSRVILIISQCIMLVNPNCFSLSVVNKLSQGGEDDLEEMRKKVHTLAEDTAIALKKNVYKNYSQFIETAKEISSILVKNSSINPTKTLQHKKWSAVTLTR